MNWFERFRCHRAAKRFARKLPAVLNERYLDAEAYTPAQVRAALAQAKLGGRYVAIAYAATLTEDDYVQEAPGFPVVVPYDKARALFEYYRPGPIGAFDPPPPSAYAMSGNYLDR